MKLNRPTGQMYTWAYTTNPLKGKCPHDCMYCYVERLRNMGLKKYEGKLELDENWFKLDLTIPEKDKVIFVQSCGDLFAEAVPDKWITRILDRIEEFPETTFLIQSKNPTRFHNFSFPSNIILGTTIETNRNYPISKAPTPEERWQALKALPTTIAVMVSIEPVLDFDFVTLLAWMEDLKPTFISIGADSKGHNLIEPSPKKLQGFIDELGLITEVRRKKNLKRLLK